LHPSVDFRENVEAVPPTIRVLEPDGTITTMDMDQYLRGVVPFEIGPHRLPAALKAQAAAARAYAATRCLPKSAGDPHTCEPGLDANVDTTVLTQAYDPVRRYDTTDEAVLATHGVAPRYEGRLIHALFFPHSDGQTRSSADVFSVTRPYLRSVADPAAFDSVQGHGVGLSQHGAIILADWGATFDEILRYFYTGVTVDPPQAPVLSDASVSSEIPDSQTAIRFEITYADAEGDPPMVADVYINDRAYPMTFVAGDFRTGARFAYTTTLEAGPYTYSFHFSDGFTEPVAIEGGRLEVTGATDAAPAPAVAGDVVRSGQWRHSSRLDWLAGSGDATTVTAGDDAALTLAGNPAIARYTSTVLEADFPFIAVGANWQADLPKGREMRIEVQASPGGTTWSEWIELPSGDGGRWVPLDNWSELAFVDGRFLRYRVTFWSVDPRAELPYLDGLTLTYIYAPAGPRPPTSAQPLSHTEPRIIPRDDWCTTCDDPPSWAPEYRTPTKFVIHHTVSANNHDGYQTVRAIHNYHANTRGWSDIGYNFLIDREGRIFEGRYGGENENGQTVVGGHALQFNYGSIGVALIGTYSEEEPSPATLNALVNLLVTKGLRYEIGPYDEGSLAGTSFPYGILGHRDVLPGHTVCPGQAAWDLLPDIRARVDAGLAEHIGKETATPTATPSPTPTLLPGCSQGVVNGGFEEDNAGWTLNRAYYTAQAHGGSQAMFIGLLDSEADQSVFASAQQQIFIPPDMTSIDLSFWYKTVARGDPNDRFWMRILDGGLASIFSEELPADTVGWKSVNKSLTSALSGHAGETVNLYFGVWNDGNANGQKAYLRLDDVSLVICRSGATLTPTPTPIASGTPPVTLEPTVSPTPTVTPTPTATPTPTVTSTPIPATPTPTVGPTVTPLPTPADWVCQNLVNDPGFEAGQAFWSIPATAYRAQITTQQAHSGTRSVLVGIITPEHDILSFSSVWQDVAVPIDAQRVTFSYWYYPISRDPEDRQIVEIREPGSEIRNRLRGFAGETSSEQQWLFRSFDLTEHYPAKEIRLYFSAFNRNQEGAPGGITALYVDDVSLEVCRFGTLERPYQVYLPILNR
jgi:hypothetical protein